MPIMREFDPATDGWSFSNWGEAPPHCLGSCDLSWDLYRQAYLGIAAESDKYDAPLDLAFYELFKICAAQGNCGGMSLLGLALYKFGGYQGFCSPACFYEGAEGPARDDLHRTINVMQAHQFSTTGIQNFLDAFDAGNLNDAEAAFHRAKELLGKGDYPLLSLAGNLIGENAHTLIPYRLDEHPAGHPPGTKVMYLWDSNAPAGAYPGHYGSPQSQLVLHSSTNWSYISGISPDYSGGAAAWCFVIPMSVVLPKARQPLALDMVISALMHVFITGTGAAVSQISDDSGRRLFRTDDLTHTRRDEYETDSPRRLVGVAPWPWFGRAAGGAPRGELSFMRGHRGYTPLTIAVSGAEYKLQIGLADQLLEVTGRARRSGRDRLTFSGLRVPGCTLQIASEAESRQVDIRHLRTGVADVAWRSVHVTGAEVAGPGLVMRAGREMQDVEVTSAGQRITFGLAQEQRLAGRTTRRDAGRITLRDGKSVRWSAADWEKLDEVEVEGDKP